jgi:acetyl/propionyl-CoA carboxylase alpha subunit
MRKLLVANRAEIASRVMRTARRMGIATVAVFSDADADMPFVRDADEAVRLPGVTAADTYLRVDAIVDAARRSGADGVHPGYGFLSERADFARACAAADLAFVGPPPLAIELMGNKIEAKRLMADAGVPVLPSGSALDLDDAITHVGLPMLVKAAFGGGGRGMRTVRDEPSLRSEVDAAQREAAAAFGDGTVFLERLVESPRHIEVQIFGDAHGNVIHLFERECSIQRRHQKIIEEAPSPAVDAYLRDELGAAAVAAAKAIGYVNAGTVEFVLAPDGQFFFLEVNTRLQVEHPVTELITGLDLVELQLRVARGEPLPPAALDASINAHAIEARLYAEDVAAGYLPTNGRIDRFRFPDGETVRVDAGYADGATVSTYYDAMLAKVIAWAPDRADAAHRLAAALRHAELHGPTTNRDLLVAVLDHPDFLAGATDTGFLERHDLARGVPPDPSMLRAHAIAASVAAREAARGASPLPRAIPPRWRNVGPAAQPVTYTAGDTEITVDGLPDDARVLHATPDAVDLEVAGRRVRCSVQRVDAVMYVDSALGASTLVEQPRFPMPQLDAAAGSLRSPMPGTVVRVDVAVGDAVAAGQVLVALEAMKMEHAIRAPYDGVVSEVRVRAGDQTETGAVLVVVSAGASDES